MDGPPAGNLTGSLLVAHPTLLDPNFRRTILFLSHHSAQDGAVGFVLNRPMGKTIGQLSRKAQFKTIKHAPIFHGGPVQTEQVTIASLQWRENPASVGFYTPPDGTEDILIDEEWQRGLRAFVGYAGWSQGQLEAEIAQNAWIIVNPNRLLIEMENPATAWRDLMRHSGPLLKLLAEAPDRPELN